MAAALRKLFDKHTHFRKKVSIEEHRAEKNDRFLRGKPIAFMIYDHFRSTRFHEEIQGLSGLLSIRLETMISNILIFDGSKHYYLRVILHRTNFWKVCTSVQISGFFSISDDCGTIQSRNSGGGERDYHRLRICGKIQY